MSSKARRPSKAPQQWEDSSKQSKDQDEVKQKKAVAELEREQEEKQRQWKRERRASKHTLARDQKILQETEEKQKQKQKQKQEKEQKRKEEQTQKQKQRQLVQLQAQRRAKQAALAKQQQQQQKQKQASMKRRADALLMKREQVNKLHYDQLFCFVWAYKFGIFPHFSPCDPRNEKLHVLAFAHRERAQLL